MYTDLFTLVAGELRSQHNQLRSVSREKLAEAVSIGADKEVTSRMDRIFEELILSILREKGVRARLISEEVGCIEINGGDPHVTVILDPLDGTTNALSGFPFYASSLAVMRGDEVEAGMIYHFSTEDLFMAFKGKGSTRNGIPLEVNREEKLSHAEIVLSRALCQEEEPLYHYWGKNCRRMRHTGSRQKHLILGRNG